MGLKNRAKLNDIDYSNRSASAIIRYSQALSSNVSFLFASSSGKQPEEHHQGLTDTQLLD